MEQKQVEVLEQIRMAQDAEGNVKIQISDELFEDLPLYIMFLAVNIEVLSNVLGISIETIFEFVKDNIKGKPIEFD